jgi:hypothetical protein
MRGSMASGVKDTDNGWKSFQKMLRSIGEDEVVIGIPGEINFSIPTTAAIGMVHEFGSEDGTIPERSFIRSTFDKNASKYSRLLNKWIEEAARKKKPNARALFVLGETARADVIASIVNQEIVQDLAESTLARKSPRTKALIDTGNLVGSIVSIVRKRTK